MFKNCCQAYFKKALKVRSTTAVLVRRTIMQEKVLDNKKNGMAMMMLFILLYAADAALTAVGATFYWIPLIVIGIIWLSLGWIPFCGLKVLKPQEALVLTLFGKYVGTLKNDGFYWVNPFCTAVNPAAKTKLNQSGDVDGGNAAKSVLTLAAAGTTASASSSYVNKKISLKIMTLNNNRQKINDCLGNPVEIGIAVMLQRQQASAIIDARKMIVDGAVGMVEMALERLNENNVVELDEERKAAMVSNLLVVLCGNHDAQPVVNSGSLY